MHNVPGVKEPVGEGGKELRRQLKPQQWAERVAKAEEQARVVLAVRSGSASGVPVSKVLRAVSPNTPWPTFQYWNARVGENGNMSWEDFLDHRIPPKPRTIPDVVRASAVMLRRLRPDMGYEDARGRVAAISTDD